MVTSRLPEYPSRWDFAAISVENGPASAITSPNPFDALAIGVNERLMPANVRFRTLLIAGQIP